MKWDPDLGIWQLFDTPWLTIGGTTPTNADRWTINFDFNRLDHNLGFALEPWPSVSYWRGNKLYTLGPFHKRKFWWQCPSNCKVKHHKHGIYY